MSINAIKGKLPHIEWLDLEENGTMTECAIMRRDRIGNIYYLQIDKLDMVDKNRLVKILNSRNVETMELWDVMSAVVLGNGVNALKYFHQLVRIITDTGAIMAPQLGKQGVAMVKEATNTPTPQEMAVAEHLLEAGKEAKVISAKRKAGRPKKS